MSRFAFPPHVPEVIPIMYHAIIRPVSLTRTSSFQLFNDRLSIFDSLIIMGILPTDHARDYKADIKAAHSEVHIFPLAVAYDNERPCTSNYQ